MARKKEALVKETDPDVSSLQADADARAEEVQAALENAARMTEASKEAQAQANARADEALRAKEEADQKVIALQAELAAAQATAAAAASDEAAAAAAEAKANADALKAEADQKAKAAADLEAKRRPSNTSFRLEGGGWGSLAPGYSSKDFRVRDLHGVTYDHCSEDVETGEWIYRRQ